MKFRNFIKYIPALALCLIVFYAGLILYFILKYGVDVPYMDQWEYVYFFDHLSKGTLTLGELFKLQGEYRQFFPNLIFVSLGWMTNWNVKYEMIVIFILACLVSLNIYRLVSFTVNEKPWIKWILFFLANIFIFTPLQYENWLFGVQIEYFMPIACVTTAMVIAFSRLDSRLKIVLCLLLGVVSSYSSINGPVYWFILFPVLYFSGSGQGFFKKWPAISIWILGTAITLFFYFHGYTKPKGFPSTTEVFDQPLEALKYFFAILGNPIRIIHSLEHIIYVGGVLVFIFIALILYILWHMKDKQLIRNAVVWIMLGMYSVMTAAMVTVGRLGFGVFQSLTSRYTTYTLYLVVATIFLFTIAVLHYAKKKPLYFLQKIGVAILIVYVIYIKVDTYPTAVVDLKNFHASIQHGKAGLLFINFISPEQCSNKIYPSHFDELTRRANILNNMGYLRPSLIKSNIMQDIEGEGSGTIDYGTFDLLFNFTNNYFVASGIAVKPNTNDPADAIILTYDNEKDKSQILTIYNDDLKRWSRMIWVGALPYETLNIKAWAFDANTGKAYKLKGSHIIIKKRN